MLGHESKPLTILPHSCFFYSSFFTFWWVVVFSCYFIVLNIYCLVAGFKSGVCALRLFVWLHNRSAAIFFWWGNYVLERCAWHNSVCFSGVSFGEGNFRGLRLIVFIIVILVYHSERVIVYY